VNDIQINAEGAGDWVMKRAGGFFTPGYDQSITRHYSSGTIRGGFVLNAYTGACFAVHNAGIDPRWCSRDLLWMVFHYAFEQIKCHKLVAPINSTNHKAMDMALRAGWELEAVIRDATPVGHLMLLTMTRDKCPWLRLIPQSYLPGEVARHTQEPADG